MFMVNRFICLGVFICSVFLVFRQLKRGLFFKPLQNPYSCVYTGPVDMFVANLVTINRVVFSIALRKDAQKTPQQIFPQKPQLKFCYDRYTFLYTTRIIE